MQIAEKTVVTVEYCVMNDEGTVLDQSPKDDPMAYLYGAGFVVPGIDAALAGREAGAELDLTLSPEEGYGQRDDALLQEVSIDVLSEVEDLAVGMTLQADGEDGPMILSVTRIEDGMVTLDSNHPLAGLTLRFTIKVVSVRAATSEELAHGHAHGPGGHNH